MTDQALTGSNGATLRQPTQTTENPNRRGLLRLADEMVEDVLAASDEEIMAEIKQDKPEPSLKAANDRIEELNMMLSDMQDERDEALAALAQRQREAAEDYEKAAREIEALALALQHVSVTLGGTDEWSDRDTMIFYVKNLVAETKAASTQRERDAFERAAKVAETHEPQHELNTAVARNIGRNIAAAIRALSDEKGQP